MTRAEALKYLYDLRLYGSKLGLENPRRLAEAVGRPQDRLRFVHVAGTNGKGSVCALLESVYRAAGYRTGMFTSPHLIDFSERIQVNRTPIPPRELTGLVEEFKLVLAAFEPDRHPTFFEVTTILALLHFARNRCELVFWETGLGGRLDATNIVSPLISIITSVSRDHTRWLGDSLAAIAREKAGIIKPEIPCLCAGAPPEAATVIRRRALELRSPIEFVTPNEAERLTTGYRLGLAGRHQRRNAALAIRTVERLQNPFPVAPAATERGLKTVSWPGRLQVLRQDTLTVILDGAHNEAGIRELCVWLQQEWPRASPSILFGALQDKEIETWLPCLLEVSSRFFLVPVNSSRSCSPAALAEFIAERSERAQFQTFDSLPEGIRAAQESATVLVVCGSMYLIGEVLANFGEQDPECVLNDWRGFNEPPSTNCRTR